MNIAGLEKLSLLDYPGKLSAVVFTQGCNWDCFYCHNRSLITRATSNEPIEVFPFLRDRQGKLQAVVMSGGEPTLQGSLASFIRECRELGYAIKLDTNGSSPHLLKTLLADNLLDYVALDIKSSWEHYQTVCGHRAKWQAVADSLELLKGADLAWEVRTTLYPGLDLPTLDVIKAQIGIVPLWRLNLYREPLDYKKSDEKRIKGSSLTRLEVQQWLSDYEGWATISN